MAAKKKKTQADIDWENRTLCSDESCIGVIGPDGRCKECGRPYEGKDRPSFSQEEIAPEEDSDDFIESEDIDDFETTTDVEWQNRTLCIDESCIGVVGPDGRCKECGKPYKPDDRGEGGVYDAQTGIKARDDERDGTR